LGVIRASRLGPTRPQANSGWRIGSAVPVAVRHFCYSPPYPGVAKQRGCEPFRAALARGHDIC